MPKHAAVEAPGGTRLLVGLFVVALAWRLLALVHDPMIDTDSAYYGAMARAFADGNWAKALDPVWPPLYPFLISLVLHLGTGLETAGLLVSIVAGAGAVVTCSLLGRTAFGPRVGLWAGVLALFHPRLVLVSQQVLTASLYVFLTSAALVTFLVALRSRPSTRGSPLLFLASGAWMASAFLTRPEAVVLLMVLGLWGLVAAREPVGEGRVRRLPGPVFLVLGFLLVSAPYLIQVQRIEGRWMPGEKGALNFFLTHRAAYEEEGLEVTPSDHDAITGADTPRRPGDYRVLEFLQRRPGHVLRHTARNLPEALFSKIPSLVYVPFVLLALFGLVSRRVVARSRFEWLFLAWIVALALCMSPLFLLRRFFVATLPLFLVWGAVGVEELRHRVSRRVFVSLVVAWSLFFAAYTHQTLAKRRPPVLYKQAGLWLRDHAGSDLVLTGRKPEPAFYAEALFVPLEARSVEALREGMRQQGVTHLIVDDYVFTRSHPALAHLMDVAQAPAWLRHVRTAADEEHRVLVYAFREP